MMSLVGYILIFAVAVILILLARVIFFILREEQAVEIELREIEKNSTRSSPSSTPTISRWSSLFIFPFFFR